jgi:hypothetical protein
MTQEDKELLLKDLCARLPHNCRVFYEYIDNLDNKTYGYSLTLNTWCINEFIANKAVIKPYLRKMSSMTKKELHEVQEILGKGVEIHDAFISIVDSSINTFSYLELQAVFDWLNKKMFDYRGLIEKGLALEAQEGMYNLEKK